MSCANPELLRDFGCFWMIFIQAVELVILSEPSELPVYSIFIES